MNYTATLDGEPLACGSLQEVQAASSEAVTGFLAQDPDGVAMSAQTAVRAFQTGAVAQAVEEYGQWRLPLWVHGEAHNIVVGKGAE